MRVCFQCLVICVLFSFQACLQKDNSRISIVIPGNTEEEYINTLQYLEDQEDSDEKYYRMAIINDKLNHTDEAISNLRQAIQINMNVPHYHHTLSNLLLKAKNTDEAFIHINKAGALGMKTSNYFLTLAQCHYELGNYEKALDVLNQYTIDKESYQRLFLKAKLYNKLQDSVKALNNLERCLAEKKNDSQALMLLTNILVSRALYDSALYYLQTVDENDIDQVLLKAELLKTTNHLDSAKKILNKGISTGKQVGRLYYELGQVHLEAKEYDSAIYYMNKILTQVSDSTNVLLALADIYTRRREYTKASQQYNMVLNIDSTHAEAADKLALLQRKIAYLRDIRKKREEQLLQLLQPLEVKKIE